jgi:cytochrome c-type biogenesis protein CcmE
VSRRWRFLIGGGVVLALGALVLTGIRQATVYFVTPSELATQGPAAGRAYRLGGMVVQGSLVKNPATREQRFVLSDGNAQVPVFFRGIPPDLFAEGRGAVVEGTLGTDGTFQASTIMAKHSEEYRPPRPGDQGHEELMRTLRTGEGATASPTATGAKP